MAVSVSRTSCREGPHLLSVETVFGIKTWVRNVMMVIRLMEMVVIRAVGVRRGIEAMGMGRALLLRRVRAKRRGARSLRLRLIMMHRDIRCHLIHMAYMAGLKKVDSDR